jgi:hypothetical protein
MLGENIYPSSDGQPCGVLMIGTKLVFARNSLVKEYSRILGCASDG